MYKDFVCLKYRKCLHFFCHLNYIIYICSILCTLYQNEIYSALRQVTFYIKTKTNKKTIPKNMFTK